MPRSKRNRVVSLTNTKKKTKDFKNSIISDVRQAIDEYERVFVISFKNMRNEKLQQVKNEWQDSKFFFGKNKVVGVGLGKGPEDEYKDDTHKISKRMSGPRGLLFTNQSKKEVLKFFNVYSSPSFARTGDTASETIELAQGPLKDLSHAIEPRLRDLGLPTKLDKGVVVLEKDHVICEEGDTLTTDQAHLLKFFGHELSEFKITPEAMWSEDTGYVEIVPAEEVATKGKRKTAATAPPAKKARREEVESEEEVEEDGQESEEDEEAEKN